MIIIDRKFIYFYCFHTHTQSMFVPEYKNKDDISAREYTFWCDQMYDVLRNSLFVDDVGCKQFDRVQFFSF